MFQFHTGSIKSDPIIAMPIEPELSFNSILVRLKDNKGQLNWIEFNAFQFHTGSIKSDLVGSPSVSETRFNSILVRLKVNAYGHDHDGHIGFNSILVRLKEDRRC